MFARLSAGKEIVVLDLKRDEDRERLHDLVAGADIFCEGFRPGVVERLGADWETLSAINPRLVYCSLSGFGSAGPLADRPGHDLNFLALAAGLPAGLSDGEALIRVPWVDLAAGTNAALTIVAALLDRSATGAGRRLDVAMLDAAAVWSAVKLPGKERRAPTGSSRPPTANGSPCPCSRRRCGSGCARRSGGATGSRIRRCPITIIGVRTRRRSPPVSHRRSQRVRLERSSSSRPDTTSRSPASTASKRRRRTRRSPRATCSPTRRTGGHWDRPARPRHLAPHRRLCRHRPPVLSFSRMTPSTS